MWYTNQSFDKLTNCFSPKVFDDILDNIQSKYSNHLHLHNIVVRLCVCLLWQLQPGKIKANTCLKYAIPLCYTTRSLLSGRPCWVHILMTLWSTAVVCHSTNVCWPSKGQISLQKSCTGKHCKNHVFVNIFAICY